jgi:hypothetical protein
MQEADSTIDTAPGQFDAVTCDDITARYRASKEYGPDWAERHAEAVIARVRQACEAKDYAYLHSLRYPQNAFSRDIFTRLTGIKLPRLQRESKRVLEEYVGPRRVAAYEDERARQRAERQAQALLSRVSSRSVSFREEVLPMDAFIRLLIGEGYIHLSEEPRGSAKQYALANEQRSSFLFYRRDERDYIEHCLAQRAETLESQVTDGNAPS